MFYLKSQQNNYRWQIFPIDFYFQSILLIYVLQWDWFISFDFHFVLFLLSFAFGGLSSMIWNIMFFHCRWSDYRMTLERVNLNGAPILVWCWFCHLFLRLWHSRLLNFVLFRLGRFDLSTTYERKNTWQQNAVLMLHSICEISGLFGTILTLISSLFSLLNP